MSSRPAAWDEILRRLPVERLVAIATVVGLEEFELTAYLVVEGAGRPAEATPWWPEAMAMRAEGQSLREIARRFQTEPRRLRRALARLALRVGGHDLAEGEGSSKVGVVRERLGAEPDGVLAKASGVIVEAVKGERRRLQRAAYFQRPRVRLTADDEAWIRGPKKLQRQRPRSAPDVLQVVRRPQARPEDVRRPPSGSFAPSVPAPRAAPAVRPVESSNRSFFRDDRWAEIERLTEPTVRRDGNRRLVRAPDAARPAGPGGNASVSDGRLPVTANSETTRGSTGGLPLLPPVGTRRVVAPQRPVGSPVAPPAMATSKGSAQVALAVAVPVDEVVDATVAWRVEVPGWEQIVTVFASDIAGAVRSASAQVPPQLLARSSIWRADQAAPGVDQL